MYLVAIALLTLHLTYSAANTARILWAGPWRLLVAVVWASAGIRVRATGSRSPPAITIGSAASFFSLSLSFIAESRLGIAIGKAARSQSGNIHGLLIRGAHNLVKRTVVRCVKCTDNGVCCDARRAMIPDSTSQEQ